MKWPGYVINQVVEKAELSIPCQPNLVLLHVGTNDMAQNISVNTAHVRLGALIDRIFEAIPKVTVVASTLLPNGNNVTQARLEIYNSNIPGMVKERQDTGRKITLVDFSSSQFSVNDLIPDGYVLYQIKMFGTYTGPMLNEPRQNAPEARRLSENGRCVVQ